MALFGLSENIFLICTAGFLFFATLPFANTSIDYLLRTNIDNKFQGRIWGLVGIISQLGYIAAYAISGLMADHIFTPLLNNGGAFANRIGKIMGTGSGRGIGFLIVAAGLLLCIAAIVVYHSKPIYSLERGENNAQ